MWINSLTSRDACANDPDQNHNLFALPGHISWACEIHASNFTSRILFLSFFFKEASLIYFIYSWNRIFSCPTVPQLVSITSVSIHLFKTLNALSWSENDLSLSSVNGFEGLDRMQHLFLAQLMVEARSSRASPLQVSSTSSKPLRPSPLARGDSDALVITPSLRLQRTLLLPHCAVRGFHWFVLLVPVPPGSGGCRGCPGRVGAPLPAVGKGQLWSARCTVQHPALPALSQAGCAHLQSNCVWRDAQPAEHGIDKVILW